ncbi:MAG: helix-turn-helix domain-containing protein [Proteobacteria bacterium]|nr:helix-turn-helix domain-containing protein [Pseudomonadota bacterium]
MLHYKGCGLDNVYLTNGYERRKTNGGHDILHIEDIEGLHRTIALTIAVNPAAIKDQEFRFLRKWLDMSQRSIAEILGVQEQTVSLWERGEQDVPQYAALFVCTMVREYISGKAAMQAIVDRLRDVDRAIGKADLLVELNSQGAWMQKAA